MPMFFEACLTQVIVMFPAQLMHPWMSISSHHQSVGETPLKIGNLLIPQIDPEVAAAAQTSWSRHSLVRKDNSL
jgi:hypothetical protein